MTVAPRPQTSSPPAAVHTLPAWIPLLLFAALLAAGGGKSIPAGNLLSVLLALVALPPVLTGRAARVADHPAWPGVAGFLLWGLLACLGAPDPLDSLEHVSRFAAAALFGALAALTWRPIHHAVFRGIVVAVAAAQSLLFAGAWISGAPVRLLLPGNPQYAGFWLCASLWLAAEGARRGRGLRRTGALSATALITVGVLLSHSRTAVGAAAAGGLLFTHRHGGRRALLAACLALLTAAAILPAGLWRVGLKMDDPSAWKRLDIWRSAAAGILEKPFWGWGPGQFETLYARHARPQETRRTRYGISTAFAHNDYLQAAADAGIPAAVFLVFGAGYFLRRRLAAGPEDDVGGTMAVATATVFSLFAFPFALPADAWLLAGLAAGTGSRTRPGTEERRVPGTRVALIGLLAVGAAVNLNALSDRFAVLGPAALRIDTRLPLDEVRRRRAGAAAQGDATTDTGRAERLLRANLAARDSDAESWHALADLYAHHVRPPRSDEAEAALRRAVFWRPTHAPWWLEWSEQLEQQGNLAGAEEAARQALRLEPAYGRASLRTGRLMRRRGDPARAERRLRALMEDAAREGAPPPDATAYEREILSRDAAELRREVARCQIARGAFEDALRTLTAAARDDMDRLVLEAEALYKLGRLGDSLRRLDAALAADPRNAGLRDYRRRVLAASGRGAQTPR